jgi:hypothetical protein
VTRALLTWLLLTFCLPTSTVLANDAASLDRIFPRSTLQIATPDARLHKFDIWIAQDDARRARGLMFVRNLGEHQGMLFIYEQEHPVSMWMKNTYISLDMLFVGADGRIERVVENTEPESLKTIESKNPVLAVIELKAGTAARLKIQPGARVIHSVFASDR